MCFFFNLKAVTQEFDIEMMQHEEGNIDLGNITYSLFAVDLISLGPFSN